MLYANEGSDGLHETLSYDEQIFIGSIEARFKAWYEVFGWLEQCF